MNANQAYCLFPKLKSLKISIECYKEQVNALCAAGFSPLQADQLILRKNSNNSVLAVLNHYQSLLDSPYCLVRAQIVKLANKSGGANNIKAIKLFFRQLTAFKFTPQQIITMVQCSGGSKNIAAVNDAFFELTALQFTLKQMMTIAAHDGGSHNIAAVIQFFSELTALGFTPKQIVALAGHIGGSKSLEAVKNNFNDLLALQFTADQIVQMARLTRGFKTLEAANIRLRFKTTTSLDAGN